MGQPGAPPFGAPGGAPQFGANPQFGTPGFTAPSGGGFLAKAAMAVVPFLCILGFVAWKFVIPMVRGGSSGFGGPIAKRDLEKEGIDIKAASPDALIAAMQKRAVKWKGDAQFYSINILGLKPDGTVDLENSSSNITIEFFSPQLVGSILQKQREDSIRKYVINKYKIDEQVWGVKKQHKDVPGTPIPKCPQKDVAKALGEKGFKDGTAHVTLDPGFAFATDGLSFNIHVDSPKLHIYMGIDDCKILKQM
jgi:hypothetical protein